MGIVKRYEITSNKMNNKDSKNSNQAIEGNQSPWFSTSELLEYLGISEIELKSYSKLFIEGVHYRHEIHNELNSPRLWRIDLIDDLLCLPIPPLEKEAMMNAIHNHITCHQ